jgi:hypothetical protein
VQKKEKKKVSYLENNAGETTTNQAGEVKKNVNANLPVHQDASQIGTKIKKRQSFGSAETSGPAQEIEKLDVKPTVSKEELLNRLDNPKALKRQKAE